MNFTTPAFLLYFLPLVTLVYFTVPRFRNFTLILASGLFYFWGEGKYLFSIYLWILANFITAKAIYTANLHYGLKKGLSIFYLVLSVAVNLGILAYFKYFTFIVSNLSILGIDIQLIDIYLPLAVSFFTFHAISYNVDVFRGVIKPESNILRLVLYFTLFPHLIAGPIIRYHQISQQLYKRVIDSDLIAGGIYRFIIGLLKKIIIANTLAGAVDEIFAVGPAHLSTTQAWLGAIGFALQIFYDFSAYTDMAIGLGMIFGFKFPENFNFPYRAFSITDFWHRWHMTLSNWIRDYVYIPLGGSRRGTLRTYSNIFITFSLVGLWHGANWTFFVWGAYHAFFLMLERIRGGILVNWMPIFLRHTYTIFALLISWVFFRSTDLIQALDFIKLMLTGQNSTHLVYFSTNYYFENDVILALLAGMIFATPLPIKTINGLKNFVLIRTVKFQRYTLTAAHIINLVIFICLSILSLIYMTGPTFQSFIYFRF